MPVGLTISALAAQSRVPISAIKYYLREGILPAGDLSAKHRAFYGARHLRRLRLVQALREVGELPIPVIRALCARLDDDEPAPLSAVIVHIIDSLGRREGRPRVGTPRQLAAARREVLRMLAAQRVRARPNARAVEDLACALVGLRQVIGQAVSASDFVPYLHAMLALAKLDFRTNAHLVTDTASAGVAATFATVLWEPPLILLRRIAHEHVATQMFGAHPSRRNARGAKR